MVVGDEVSLGAAFRQGGVSLLVALMAVAVVQSLDNAALGVLAPDIQESLGVSSAVLGAIGGAAGVLFVMGRSPSPRWPTGGAAPRSPAPARSSTACCRSRPRRSATPSGSSWPGWAPGSRPRTSCRCTTRCWPTPTRSGPGAASSRSTAWARRSASCSARSPSAAIASLVGGVEGWRWAFVAVGVPALGLSLFVATRREPPRGMNEQIAVLGETIETERSPVPISTSIAFGRLKQISTFRYMLIGIGALGFGLFSVPIFLNVFMEDTFGLSALRAWRGRLDRRRALAARPAVRGPAQRPAVPRVAAEVARAVRRADLAVRRVRDRGAVHAERGVVRGRARAGHDVRQRRVHADRPDRGRRRALPAADAGLRHGRRVRVPVRRLPRRGPGRADERRLGRADRPVAALHPLRASSAARCWRAAPPTSAATSGW